MASHNCFQTVVKHGFVHHSIGGIPCCGIKRIDIVGYMGISEDQTVAGKMLAVQANPGVEWAPSI